MAPDTTPPGGATRYIQTTRGLLSYSQLAPLLAEKVLLVERSIAAGTFGAGSLSPDLILEFHREIVGDLCPEWAGRWRDVEVRVTQRHSAAKPQANYAKRLECVELAPAFAPPLPYDSASKLDALQTLRVAVHPQKPSRLTNNFDYCSTMQRGTAGPALPPMTRLQALHKNRSTGVA